MKVLLDGQSRTIISATAAEQSQTGQCPSEQPHRSRQRQRCNRKVENLGQTIGSYVQELKRTAEASNISCANQERVRFRDVGAAELNSKWLPKYSENPSSCKTDIFAPSGFILPPVKKNADCMPMPAVDSVPLAAKPLVPGRNQKGLDRICTAGGHMKSKLPSVEV